MCIEIKTTYLAYSEFAICAVLDISKLTATDMFQIKGIALQVGKPCTAVYNVRVETARRRRQQRARQKLFAGEVEIMEELVGKSSYVEVRE